MTHSTHASGSARRTGTGFCVWKVTRCVCTLYTRRLKTRHNHNSRIDSELAAHTNKRHARDEHSPCGLQATRRSGLWPQARVGTESALRYRYE